MVASRGNRASTRQGGRRQTSGASETVAVTEITPELEDTSNAVEPSTKVSLDSADIAEGVVKPLPDTSPGATTPDSTQSKTTSQKQPSSKQQISKQQTSKGKPMSTSDVTPAETAPTKSTVAEKSTKNGNGAIQLHQQASLSITDRPVMPSDLEVVSTIQVAGIRPIVASPMAIFGTILNGRPIMSSHLTVAEMLPGGRPVFFSEFQSVASEGLPGHRPIMISDPAMLSAAMLPGNRPIFSNQIDDATTLMGYID